MDFYKRVSVVIFAFIVLVFVILTFSDTKADTEPIVQSNVTIVFDTISRVELRSIFSGKLKSYDGISLTIYVQPRHSLATIDFAKNVLLFSVDKFYSDITDWSSVGYAKLPRFVNNDYEMMMRVSSTPFSIGYASDGSIYQNQDEEFRILKVED